MRQPQVNRQKLIVIPIGNIGAGKTSSSLLYAKSGYVTISRDKLRYMLGNDRYIFNKLLELPIFVTERRLCELLMEIGVNIYIDDVFVSKRLRFGIIEMAKEYKYKIIAFVLPRISSTESVRRRIHGDSRGIHQRKWLKIWEMFDKQYEYPTMEEGFDFIYDVEKNPKPDPRLKLREEKDALHFEGTSS